MSRMGEFGGLILHRVLLAWVDDMRDDMPRFVQGFDITRSLLALTLSWPFQDQVLHQYRNKRTVARFLFIPMHPESGSLATI